MMERVTFYSAMLLGMQMELHTTGMQDGKWKFSNNAEQPTILMLLVLLRHSHLQLQAMFLDLATL